MKKRNLKNFCPKISDVIAQAVGIQSINAVSRSKIFRCVQQFFDRIIDMEATVSGGGHTRVASD